MSDQNSNKASNIFKELKIWFMKLSKKKKAIVIVAVVLFLCVIVQCSSDPSKPKESGKDNAVVSATDISSNVSSENESSATNSYQLDLSEAAVGSEIDTGNLKLEFGDLISVIYGGDNKVVVKAKIEPSYNNNATINQNYFSIGDLIRDHGFEQCSEIQYWAIADMTSGDEAKVISFTVNSATIKMLYNQNIADNQLGDYVEDLWILPSLKN